MKPHKSEVVVVLSLHQIGSFNNTVPRNEVIAIIVGGRLFYVISSTTSKQKEILIVLEVPVGVF